MNVQLQGVNKNLAGGARGQCVTDCGSRITLLGALDRSLFIRSAYGILTVWRGYIRAGHCRQVSGFVLVLSRCDGRGTDSPRPWRATPLINAGGKALFDTAR